MSGVLPPLLYSASVSMPAMNFRREFGAISGLSDSQNWRTVEFILEGAVFLAMGLELSAIVGDVGTDSTSIGVAAGLAAVALLLTILVRGAHVARSRSEKGATSDRDGSYTRLSGRCDSGMRSPPDWA